MWGRGVVEARGVATGHRRLIWLREIGRVRKVLGAALTIFVEIFDLGARRRYRRERSEFFGMPNKRRHAHTQEDLQDMPREDLGEWYLST